MREKISRLLATGGGIGGLPKAPGSWGALVAVAFFALTGSLFPAVIQSVLLVFLFLTGIWASENYALQKGEKDPPEVVIDEITGQWLTLIGFEVTFSNLLLGFLFFRLFDIWKPLPIRLGEKLSGGLGIMVDDILAGIAAHFALSLVNRFLLG